MTGNPEPQRLLQLWKSNGKQQGDRPSLVPVSEQAIQTQWWSFSLVHKNDFSLTDVCVPLGHNQKGLKKGRHTYTSETAQILTENTLDIFCNMFKKTTQKQA